MNPLRPALRLLALPRLAPLQQTRSISWFDFGKKTDGAAETGVPVPDSNTRSIADLLKQSPRSAAAQPALPVRGTLADSSIFGDEEAAHGGGDDAPAPAIFDSAKSRALRDPERANWKWPKTAAARDVRRRGRLTRTEQIEQTEREHTAASHFFKTSMKKLAPLSRQIMGKSVEDAITQMRFSPKKAARDVLAHLRHTRDEAIVRKGMDPGEMYISQAWVGRGTYGKGLNHRARGRIDMLRLPYTSKSRRRRRRRRRRAVLTLDRNHARVQGAGHPRPHQAREGGQETEKAGPPAPPQPPHLRTAAVLPVVDAHVRVCASGASPQRSRVVHQSTKKLFRLAGRALVNLSMYISATGYPTEPASTRRPPRAPRAQNSS